MELCCPQKVGETFQIFKKPYTTLDYKNSKF